MSTETTPTPVPSTTTPPTAAATTTLGADPPPTPGASTPPPTPATTTEAKPPEPPVAAAPADFELKPPEGIDPAVTADALKEFKALAKESGLKAADAQKTVDLFAKAAQAAEVKRAAELDRLQSGWLESLKADKELGGAGFEANAQVARKAIAKFGTPELRAFFESTGLGNHPEFVRFAHRVGKALGEDSLAGTGTNGHANASNDEDAFLRAMYPTMFEKQA